jgi:MOSC domain-containing protein YiiM
MAKGQDKISTPMHAQPQMVRFSVEHGIEGDRWKVGKDIESQVSLTSAAVTQLVAGARHRWHLLGNNLIVDLDLSASALPVGTRLALGTGEIEITGKPHDPCDRYQARLGKTAHSWVGDEKHADRHLRGRYAKVTRSGQVAVGELISIVPG